MDDILTLRMTRKVFTELKKLLADNWIPNEIIGGNEFKFSLRETGDHQIDVWVTVRTSREQVFLVEMKR